MIKNERPVNKRRLATEKGVKYDLKNELQIMFEAFHAATKLYEVEILQTPVADRARGFEASLLNSKIIQCIRERFPENCKFAKYKRFTLKVNGYTILFKKLDRHDKPMNVKTKLVQSISQQLTFDFFGDSQSNVHDPILFFGYNKDRIGNISNPKVVYIDEDKVVWKITLDDISIIKPLGENKTDNKIASPAPTIKRRNKDKKKNA